MTKASTILTLPIVEVLQGETIGKAEEIIVNTDTKNIYLVLDGTRAGNQSLVNLKEVLGIGNDFILLKSAASIKKMSEYSDLVKELEDGFVLLGIPGVSTSGSILGKIVDFEIGDSRDDVQSVELDNGEKYGAEQFYSICEKYVFIQENEETMEPGAFASQSTGGFDAAQGVKEQTTQREEDAYLVGLTLQEDVRSTDGAFSLERGTVLTAKHIAQAREHDALVTLATSAE